jgi:hypothetical protein
LDSPTPVRIGTYFASGSEVGPVDFWGGAIDEVGITGRVMSPAEIQAIVAAGSNGRQPAVANMIRGNSIWSNGDQAIDLNDDGRTRNDPGELFGGANRGQNTPILKSAVAVEGGVELTFILQSRPGSDFHVDFYAGPQRRFVQSVTVRTDESGYVRVVVPMIPVASGDTLVATATDVFGNTSEFSDPFPID